MQPTSSRCLLRAWRNIYSNQQYLSTRHTRSFCTTAGNQNLSPAGDDDVVQSTLEKEQLSSLELESKVLKISNAVARAREAVIISAGTDSDDRERDQATSYARYAIRSYQQLAQSSNAKDVESMEKLELDINTLKEELYKSRCQRVWMGWNGWF